jgi:hypothetical protein
MEADSLIIAEQVMRRITYSMAQKVMVCRFLPMAHKTPDGDGFFFLLLAI